MNKLSSPTTLIKHIVMVCGYRGTGKDTLYLQLSQKSGTLTPIPYNWNEYRIERSRIFPSSVRDLSNYSLIRVGFADTLKNKVHSLYPFTTKEEMRPYYIALGKEKREKDKDYWCKKAFKYFEVNPSSNNILFVTDWRFPNELVYAKRRFGDENITTVRVYRREVPLPPENEESERSLDGVSTDFVLSTDDLRLQIVNSEMFQSIFPFPLSDLDW